MYVVRRSNPGHHGYLIGKQIEYTYSKQSRIARKGAEDDTPEKLQRSQLFATCLYGIPFICLGNMAGNAIFFGLNIQIACGVNDPSNGAVRAVAIGVATFACSLHILSRWWGIALNNFFGSVKAAILVMLIVVGIVSFAGGFQQKTKPTAVENFGNNGFGTAETSSNGYASSFLSVIFAYGGFNQANYVCPDHMLSLSLSFVLTDLSSCRSSATFTDLENDSRPPRWQL